MAVVRWSKEKMIVLLTEEDVQIRFAARAVNSGALDMPVLFLNGAYDQTCETVTSRLAEPMRRDCRSLDRGDRAVRALDGAGETGRSERCLTTWLAAKFPELWTT